MILKHLTQTITFPELNNNVTAIETDGENQAQGKKYLPQNRQQTTI